MLITALGLPKVSQQPSMTCFCRSAELPASLWRGTASSMIRLEPAECFLVTANNLGSSCAAMRRAAFGSAFPKTLGKFTLWC